MDVREIARLPEYQCFTVIRAAKITAIEYDRNWECNAAIFGEVAVGEGESPPRLLLDKKWYSRNGPVRVGGYIVVNDSGYATYQPALVFEKGHTKLVP